MLKGIPFINRLGYWLPIVLFIVVTKNQVDFYSVLGNILLALFFIFFCRLFSSKKIKLTLEALCLIVFNLIMLVQISHYYIFSDKIRLSTFYIIFDSNPNESMDFLFTYLDTKLIILILLLVLSTLLSILSIKKLAKENKFSKFNIFCLFLISACLLNNTIRANTFPYTIYKAITNYTAAKKKFKTVNVDKFGGKFTHVSHKTTNEDEIYVLILGESTTRNHMSLYNYYRNTNPKLNDIKNELIIYKDVISSNTHSIPSLEKILTLSSYEHPNKKFDGTIIQLFNKAGFKTYWVSNQKPVGINETNTTIISQSCDEKIFVNTSGYGVKSLDRKLLKPFKNILENDSSKKLIILHLMGTHVQYKDQYDSDYNQFQSNPNTKFKHQSAFKTINTYDNAVLYNDYIVSEFINELKLTHTKSFALYLSDHGEDVYETLNFTGHLESNGSKPMYDIPFILWQSEKFKKENYEFIFDINRKYSTEHLIYTFSDLAHVNFKEFDATKSIVNKNFVEKERILSNKIDYDEYFKAKKN